MIFSDSGGKLVFLSQRNEYSITRLHDCKYQLCIRPRNGGKALISDHKSQVDAMTAAKDLYGWKK